MLYHVPFLWNKAGIVWGGVRWLGPLCSDALNQPHLVPRDATDGYIWPTAELVFFLAACSKQVQIGPSANCRVEPRQAVMVGRIVAS